MMMVLLLSNLFWMQSHERTLHLKMMTLAMQNVVETAYMIFNSQEWTRILMPSPHEWRCIIRLTVSMSPQSVLRLMVLGNKIQAWCLLRKPSHPLRSLAGNVGNMLATCRQQGKMLPIFVPTGQFWQHGLQCVGTLLCRYFPTLTYQGETTYVHR